MKFLHLTIWLLLSGYNITASSETLVVLQTTDIHCHIDDARGSWLKLATIINRERLAAGADNSLLIDCGDTLTGSFASTVCRGDIAVKMLNLLNYDVWIPGNHDYDFGLDALLEYRKQFTGSMLAANLVITGRQKKYFRSWRMFQRKGIKVAVIGLSLTASEKNYWRKMPFTVTAGIEEMQQIMREIKLQQPDFIILAAHCGIYSANKILLNIARQHPEINLFLGGHTHVNIPGEKIGAQSWYVQSGKHARGVAKITVKLSQPDHRIEKITSHIIPVTADTPADKQCSTALRTQLKKVDCLGQQRLGLTERKISAGSKPGKMSEAAKLNGMAMATAAKTSIAFSSAYYRANIEPGSFDRQQAFSLYPYLDTICVLSLNSAETVAIIEEQTRQSSRYHWLLPVGLHFRMNGNGEVTGKLRFADGAVWNEKRRVRIAFSSYDLAGIYGNKYRRLHQISLKPECQGFDTGIKIYQAIAEYIEKHSPLNIR